MIEALNYDDPYVVTTTLVIPRVPSRLVSFLAQNSSRNHRSRQILSLLPLSQSEIKNEDFVDDIISSESTMATATLKGADQTLLDAMKLFFCALPCYFEEFVA